MARDTWELDRIGQTVGDILDRGIVRGKFQSTDVAELKALVPAWENAGGDASELRRSIAAAGMLNASPPGDPLNPEATGNLVASKQRWRSRFWR